jgi:hypothetical protein
MDVYTDIQTCEPVEVRSLAVEEESKLAVMLQDDSVNALTMNP